MEQRLSIVTIGVDDLEAMTRFYHEQFGWAIEARAKDIVFFKLNGFLLALYGRENLADFTRQVAQAGGFRPYSFAYMVSTREEVESLYEQFMQRGIKIVTPPQEPSFGGYYFLAADLEGNIWEVAVNPFIALDAARNVVSHANIDNL